MIIRAGLYWNGVLLKASEDWLQKKEAAFIKIILSG